MDEVNSKTKMTEERVNELKKEIIPSEQQRENGLKKIEQRLRDFWKTKDLVFISSESKKEKRKQSTENLLEGKKMSEIFLNLAEDINLQM